MRLHVNKKGLRVLGIAESFRATDEKSTLGGVVMRGDLIIDGFVFGRATVGGDDATETVIRMYKQLRRNDINVIMLSGCIISMYNIIDLDKVSSATSIPVICLTYKESKGIEDAIRYHFSKEYERKIEAYRKLGERNTVRLKTGHKLYTRLSKISMFDAEKVLNLFTLQGSIPEPVRVARLLAKAHNTLLHSSV